MDRGTGTILGAAADSASLLALLQGMIYSGRGGLVGYMESYTRHDMAWQTESGFVAVFAESFPILAMMGYAIMVR